MKVKKPLLMRKGSLKRLLSFGRSSHEGEGEEEKESSFHENRIPFKHRPSKSLEIFPHHISSPRPQWKCFSYEEVRIATNTFSPENFVGKGGYGDVYRGVLKGGQVVAVKKLSCRATAADEQREKEFLTELGTIGHVRHPNICCLVGCCVDNGLHLIFEFSAHGCLASHLHDNKSGAMDWRTRYKIAIGTARGLHYLHKGCPRRIIHRDIKASNVLLTADFEPQISDFGLAKWLPSQWTHHSVTPIEGTVGYLAPEYFCNGIVDEKTDVFAFGVLLLELVSGRKPVDGSHQNLLSWAKPYLEKGDYQQLLDPRLEDYYDIQQLNRLALTASLCIRSSAAWRISMNEVVDLLVDGLILESWNMPPQEEEVDFSGFDDLDFDGFDDSPLSTPPRTSTSSCSN